MDLLDLLAEIESGPRPCTHPVNLKTTGYGYVLELDPNSEFLYEWVDADPNCRRSSQPGKNIQYPNCKEGQVHEWQSPPLKSAASGPHRSMPSCTHCGLPLRAEPN